LVECGYLSNPEEEKLLLDEDYKKEVCYCILLGVLEYLR
jgi:N-acetylmuramoyl-L-alanine amidase